MIEELVMARKEHVCYFCLEQIKIGDYYYSVRSPFQRSIGIKAICCKCRGD